MTYCDFTLELLRRNFGLQVVDAPLFSEIGRLEPSPWLKTSLRLGADLRFSSEKARSEFIVAPVLLACRDALDKRFHIFSGIRLDADVERGLKGECDFLIARTTSAYSLQAPLMVVLEAKKNDVEEGVPQCAAQLLGARLYNAQDGMAVPFVYGCVTTGELWQFMKLEGSQLTLHPQRLTIDELDQVLWFLCHCVEDVDKRAPAGAAA
jgi:hypothetical protein